MFRIEEWHLFMKCTTNFVPRAHFWNTLHSILFVYSIQNVLNWSQNNQPWLCLIVWTTSCTWWYSSVTKRQLFVTFHFFCTFRLKTLKDFSFFNSIWRHRRGPVDSFDMFGWYTFLFGGVAAPKLIGALESYNSIIANDETPDLYEK